MSVICLCTHICVSYTSTESYTCQSYTAIYDHMLPTYDNRAGNIYVQSYVWHTYDYLDDTYMRQPRLTTHICALIYDSWYSYMWAHIWVIYSYMKPHIWVLLVYDCTYMSHILIYDCTYMSVILTCHIYVQFK